MVSDKLGVPFDDVEVVHGDTGRVEFGLGTYGSRSLAVGGSALISAADKIIAKGTRIAAHMMQAEPGNVAFEEGAFISGNQRLTLQEVAFASYVPADYPPDLEPGLSEKAFYDPENFTYPAGAHIAEVEVDEATGVVQLVNFVAVDDFGQVINPMIVDGQVHGGLAQGAGQALLEHGIYDADGQLTTGSYMDYCMPRADDVPDFTVDTTVTPAPTTRSVPRAAAKPVPSVRRQRSSTPYAVHEDRRRHGPSPCATPEQVWRKLHGL